MNESYYDPESAAVAYPGPEEPARQGPNTWVVVILVIVGLLLLCCCCAVAAWFLGDPILYLLEDVFGLVATFC